MATVKKTNATRGRTSSEIDLFSDIAVPRSVKSEVKEKVGEFLKDQILLAVGNQKSPVSGEGWPALSKNYKAYKKGQGLPGEANMEFTGSMLDSLDYRPTTDGVEVGVFGSDAKKADGHNNFTGSSPLPQRRFLPGDGQKFKANIQSKIDEIIANTVADNVNLTESKLSGIQTKSALFELLGLEFEGFTRRQISSAILGNPDLVSLFERLNLLRFLGGN